MKNRYIYNLDFATLSFFLVNSYFINVGFNVLTINSMTDSIIDIIIGGIMIILFVSLVLWIRKCYDKDLISTIFSFKILKYPLTILLLIIIGISTIYSLTNLTSFIHFYMLKEVDAFTISISLILTIIYLVRKNLPTITRISEICFYIYMFIFILGFIGLYKYIDLSNLKPLLTTSINSHIKTSFTFFNYSIFPIFLLLGLKQDEYENKDNLLIIIFTLLGILTIFLEAILIISVLGINLTNMYQNPDIMIYKKISFLNIFERVEVFLSFNQLLNGIFIITINFYLMKKIIISVIKKEKELIILTLLGILFLFLSNIITISKDTYLFINTLLIFITFFILIRTIIYKYILHLQDQF